MRRHGSTSNCRCCNANCAANRDLNDLCDRLHSHTDRAPYRRRHRHDARANTEAQPGVRPDHPPRPVAHRHPPTYRPVFAAAMNDEDVSPYLSPSSAIPRHGGNLAAYFALSAPITEVTIRCSVQSGMPGARGIEWIYVVFAIVTTTSGDKYVGVQMDTSQSQLRILATNPPSSFPLPAPGGPY